MVPNGWKETKLIDTSAKEKYSFTGGPFGSDLKSSDYTDNGVRIIQLQNIGDGKFNNGYKIFTSEEKADELSSCNIFPGEIILSKMGDPVARATIIPSHHKRYLMASDGIRLKVDESKYDTFFIHEVINAPHFRGIALSKSTGSTRKRIGLTDLKNITFHCPPLIEQQKIAKILSTWDKAISTTERLIDNSKQQKKALMQQLLTGKKRLFDDNGKPFEGEWKEVKLSNTVSVNRGYAFKSELYSDSGYQIVRVTNISSSGYIDLSECVYIPESQAAEYKDYELQDEDVLIVMVGATAGKLGFVTESILPALLNQNMWCLRTKDSSNLKQSFFKYLANQLVALYTLTQQGSARGFFTQSTFGLLKFKIPPIEEQQKIATILTNADKEIELLEQQLADLQQEKKALMQVLLTGKKRVLV